MTTIEMYKHYIKRGTLPVVKCTTKHKVPESLENHLKRLGVDLADFIVCLNELEVHTSKDVVERFIKSFSSDLDYSLKRASLVIEAIQSRNLCDLITSAFLWRASPYGYYWWKSVYDTVKSKGQ